jgi:hypothetical protein
MTDETTPAIETPTVENPAAPVAEKVTPETAPAVVEPVAEKGQETPEVVELPLAAITSAIPLHIRFSVLEAEFESIMQDTLETVKSGEANVLSATATEMAKVKAKWNEISQWAARRIPRQM